ncbi:hypothetical protein BDR22DRAFT_828201 [Usnea florida]
MASTSNSDPANWTPPESNCDKCGAPSCWAEDWTQNLSWFDGAKLHLSTYFASPRMWPLGYILGSPYSPLNLEEQYPNFNWRDSFEDLLALESGKKMISAVSRQNEALTASRVYNETVHDEVSHVNQVLQRNQDYVVLLLKLREIAVRRKYTDTIAMIDDEALPAQKQSTETAIAMGKSLIRDLKDLQNKPASSYKRRVPWITSLISSGAMLGWKSVLYDSSDGWHADVYRDNASGDGHTFSEGDLALNFKNGPRLNFSPPTWSTCDGYYNNYYPQIDQYCPDADDPDADDTYQKIDNLRPSVLSHTTTVQHRKSWNGSIETRVMLRNCFTDGQVEEKMIVNDPSKVFEEVEKAHSSIRKRHHAIGLALWELLYRKQKESLTVAQEMEDDGVE